MQKIFKNVFASIIICSLISILCITGCTKENLVLQDESIKIDTESYVPFFYVAKGDTVPDGVFREKPDFTDEEPIILFSTENETGAKATGTTDGSGGYLNGLYISIRNKNDVSEWLWDGLRKIPVDLNEGAGGRYIYLFYSRDNIWGQPMRDITVAKSDMYNYYMNYGYKCALKENGRPGNVNEGAGGREIYVYYRATTGPNPPAPIRELMIVSSTSSNQGSFPGWINAGIDLNEGAGGRYIYLYYKR